MTAVKTLILTILASAAVPVANAIPIRFVDCTGSNQTLSVDISPCTSQPCTFSDNGHAASVRVTFKAPADSSTLKVDIYGYVLGVKVRWPMPNSNGCVKSNITCPIVAGNVYTYTANLAVPRGTPAMQLTVEWDMIDEKNEKAFCFDFPIQISSSNIQHHQYDHSDSQHQSGTDLHRLVRRQQR